MAPIVCDMDGVLANFNWSFGKLLMKLQPEIQLDLADPLYPKCWDYPQAYGFSAQTEAAAWAHVKLSGLFWQHLLPYPTAKVDIALLKSLQGAHDIYFLTTRPGQTAKRETEHWLYGQGFNDPTVVIGYDKAAFCTAVKAGVLIEDKPENLVPVEAPCRVRLIRRPYNREWWKVFPTADTVEEALRDVT